MAKEGGFVGFVHNPRRPNVDVFDSETTSSVISPSPKFELRFPERDEGWDQDEERFELELDGETRQLRSHDYAEIFAVPGLYEQLFYDVLKCQSPQRVCGLLAKELRSEGADTEELTVLDLGAGNGMVAEELAELGAETIVGVDIIPEAEMAAERDRPEVYEDYHVVDLTDIPPETRSELEDAEFNCLTSVAALGFGDIPPLAFTEAYNFVEDEGWVAFNIKEQFLNGNDDTGFSQLMRRMIEEGAIELRGQERYQHRVSIAGDPLHYVAMVGRKQAEVPTAWLADLTAD